VNIITLTTDFGNGDIYVGVMKGVILSINPNATIVDITHDISPHNIKEGAFLLNDFYRYFPKGSIHLVVVDPGVGSERKGILIESDGYFFVGPDNGIFTYPIKKGLKKIIELSNKSYYLNEISSTFHGRDIFAPVAAHLSLGIEPDKFGNEIKEYKILNFDPEISENGINGEIIHIDKFGNLITDIKKEFMVNKDFEILIKDIKIDNISESYFEGKEKEILAIFGSSGWLELSVNMGNAADIIDAKVGDRVLVRWKK